MVAFNPDGNSLYSFEEIRQIGEWPSILIGNGVSTNLHPGFSYISLFAEANLPTEVRNIFSAFDTANFEQILKALRDASRVCRQMGLDVEGIDAAYVATRDSLLSTVEARHVRWDSIPESIEETIADEVCRYRQFFTTNYDLCIYWALINQQRKSKIKDFFWGRPFDPADVHVANADAVTCLYYLHGALHLWQDEVHENGKWTSAEGRLHQTLARYGEEKYAGRSPLFVSEGTAEEKSESIAASPYLRFCLRALENNAADIVLVGISLDDTDQHIANALARHSTRRFAVGIYNDDDDEGNRAVKLRYRKALGSDNIFFFDSKTHPLASPNLRVE